MSANTNLIEEAWHPLKPKDRGVAMAFMMTVFDVAAGAGSMIAGAVASIIEISTVFKLASLSLLVLLPFITVIDKS